MKLKGALEKWASGVLGAVCLILLLNLFRHGVGAAKPALPPAHVPGPRRIILAKPGTKDELSKYDPEIKLRLLTDLQSRRLPLIARDPFEFPPKVLPRSMTMPVMGPSLPPPPPPPPPLPLKLIGYSEKIGGVREAIILEEEDIYVVHEGEIFAQKYRVTKITPLMAEIVVETTRQTVQLPIVLAP